ncbi:MAG TPA: hypothetical protein VFT38_01400 [Vicinamibacteria bacterium]|nr:hypothetical protein [Vicinamibacteria bacterium]
MKIAGGSGVPSGHIWGRGDAQIRVDAASFAGDQRAVLDRALARRIVEPTRSVAR